MGIKFQYAHEFQETSVDAVRSKIVAWLNAEGAPGTRRCSVARMRDGGASERAIVTALWNGAYDSRKNFNFF